MSKKGIAGPGGDNPLDLAVQQNAMGAEWWYNWHYHASDGIAEYVPMIRSIHNSWSIADIESHPAGGYWLVGNEPDLASQDNLTAMEAAVSYGEIVHTILGVDPSAKIIVGGFKDPSQYTRTTYKAQFESAWMTCHNEDVREVCAGYHVHAYVHPLNEETIQQALQRVTERQLRAWVSENPGLELWVTECGSLQADADYGYLMPALIEWLDAEPGIDRYAWFYNGDTNHDWDYCSLWKWTDGCDLPELTALGTAYMALPGGTEPDVPVTPTEPVSDDDIAEILRLVREIHAAVVG